MYVIKDGISLVKVFGEILSTVGLVSVLFLRSTTAPPSRSKRVTQTPNGAQFRVLHVTFEGAAIQSLTNTKRQDGCTVTDPTY